MKNKVCILICFLVMSGLVSCNIPPLSENDSSQGEIEQQYHTVSVLLTQTAQGMAPVSMTVPVAASTPSPVSEPTATKDSGAAMVVPDTSTPEHTATTSSSPVVSDGKALAAPCDLAQLGYPIDISVPDGSRFLPGQTFSKTWRLVNNGSCTWTSGYALVWFSGTNLGLTQVQPLSDGVNWGSSVDITVDMIAPAAPGTYQSNWKMRNPAGELFGIGPNGDAPVWVRIVVVPMDTPTVTPTVVEATPTPGIYASGTLSLVVGEGIDLDSARINQEQEDDLRLLSPATGEFQLAPLTGAHLSFFEAGSPQLIACEQSERIDTQVMLAQDRVGVSYCYRTTQGLPGRLTIKSVDLEKGQVDLEFITWVVP